MQRMMAKKVWSLRIINFLMIVLFISWVVLLKYCCNNFDRITLLEDELFNQSMFQFELFDIQEYYKLYNEDDSSLYDEESDDEVYSFIA